MRRKNKIKEEISINYENFLLKTAKNRKRQQDSIKFACLCSLENNLYFINYGPKYYLKDIITDSHHLIIVLISKFIHKLMWSMLSLEVVCKALSCSFGVCSSAS